MLFFFFPRYLYKLCDLHLGVKSYTEAAFTLLQHAELLEVDMILLLLFNLFLLISTEYILETVIKGMQSIAFEDLKSALWVWIVF